jgi:hypothetical protein
MITTIYPLHSKCSTPLSFEIPISVSLTVNRIQPHVEDFYPSFSDLMKNEERIYKEGAN